MNGFIGNRRRGREHMNKTFKIVMIVMLALVTVMSLTACGGGFTGNPAIFN